MEWEYLKAGRKSDAWWNKRWADGTPSIQVRTPPRASAQSWTKYVGVARQKSKPAGFVAGGLFQPNCFESELGR